MMSIATPKKSIAINEIEWNPGTLYQVQGRFAPDVAARVLAAHRHLPAAWIKKSLVEFPLAIFQRRVNLEKVLFIQGERDSFWAAGNLVRTQLFPFLIYQAPMNDKIFATLAEWAEVHSTCILVISDRELTVARDNIRIVHAVHRGSVVADGERSALSYPMFAHAPA